MLRTILVCAVLTASSISAAEPYLVKDINQTTFPAGSYPSRFVAMGSLTFFNTADYYGSPTGLWRTDGTSEGTIALGTGGGEKVVSNGRLWFINAARELWSTDGTVAGTQKLESPAGVTLAPSNLMTGPSHLYFLNGHFLWRTDGTTAGTVQISAIDFPTGVQGSAVAGGTLYFAATAQGLGVSLWKTDATGTYLVLSSKAYTEVVGSLTAIGNTIYFVQAPYYPWAGLPSKLWRFDNSGTPAVLIKSLRMVYDPDLPVSGSQLYFAGDDGSGGKLWRTDGVTTTAVATSLPGDSATFDAFPMGILPNGVIICLRFNGYTNLWAFDGLTSTPLGVLTSGNVSHSGTVAGNSMLVGSGADLWRTDGTVAGTFSLGTLNGTNGYVNWEMAANGPNVFFGANGGLEGDELWMTDGSVANTHLVRDIVVATEGSLPARLVPFKGGVIFDAISDGATFNAPDRDLWFSDGTEAGTQKILAKARAQEIVPCGQRAYFSWGTTDTGQELWSTDGTAAGTTLFRDFYPGSTTLNGVTMANSSDPSRLLCVDNTLYFTAFSSSSPNLELWRTDGTLPGTMMIRALGSRNGGGFTFDRTPTPYGHRMVWGMRNDAYANQFWTSDGTAAGTAPLITTGCQFLDGIQVAGPNLYLSASGCSDGNSQLWRSNGTTAGTNVFLRDSGFVLWGGLHGRLVFRWITGGGYTSRGTCSTDGTEADTVCFEPGPSVSGSWDFVFRELNGRLYYNLPALWSTDGAARTPTTIQYAGQIFESAGGRLYVNGSPFESPSTLSLMETDGSPSGTFTLMQRAAGDVAASGGRLFIASDELYAYDLPVTPVSFAPHTVDISGGQTVVVSGRGFSAPATVTIGEAIVPASVTSTSLSFVAPPEIAGTYDIVMTLGDGRTMKTDEPITYACSAITATASGPAGPFCPLTTVTLTGSGGERCAWFPATGLDDPSSCTPHATPAVTTTYTLIVINPGGCASTNHPSVTVTVAPPPDPTITILENTLALRPNNTYTASVPDGGAGVTYAWTGTGIQFIGDVNQRMVSFQATCAPPTLHITVTNSLGCAASANAAVFVSPGHLLTSFSPVVAHPGTTVTLTGQNFDCVDSVILRSFIDYIDRSVPFTRLSSTTIQFVYPPDAAIRAAVGIAVGSDVRFGGGTVYSITHAAPGDFNLDLFADITLQRSDSGAILQWQMSGSRIISEASLSPGTPWVVKAVGDFDGDGKSDLVLQHPITKEVAVWLMNGRFIRVGAVVASSGAYDVVKSGDFDFDGKSDILFQDPITGDVAVWLMNGTAIKRAAAIASPGAAWVVKATGDFNGDGRADIILQSADGSIAEWQLDGSAIVTGGLIIDGPFPWSVAATGDFNFDHKSDLVLRAAGGDIAIWQMNGYTITAGAVLGNPGASWSVAGTGEYDGALDGADDIILRNASGDIAQWFISGLRLKSGFVVRNPGTTWVPRLN